jgi:formate--tetrahydrofolate ligase
VRARDLLAHGAMTVLLKDAIKPNLVQTLENNPAILHGGPFANIAHGCNSVTATRAGLKLADYVVTEAGFGADLGAEKFVDIKCRKAGLKPSGAVIVATLRALKYHGGVDLKELTQENVEAVEKGLANLERHVENVRDHYGIRERLAAQGVKAVRASHWADGGKGAEELAHAVVDLCDREPGISFVYEDADPLWEKMEKIAKKVYRADGITADAKVKEQIARLQADYGHYPVCVAKTQYSFSTDPARRNAPTGYTINVREVRLSAGAEFVVMICGDVMTMPGLPKVPSATRIDIDEQGKVVGLF